MLALIPWRPWQRAWQSLSPEALWPADYATLDDYWQELTNVTASGPNGRTLTKTGGGVAWNAAGASCVVLPGDGWVEFSTSETNKGKMAGLTSDNPDDNYTHIDNAIYADAGGGGGRARGAGRGGGERVGRRRSSGVVRARGCRE